MGTRVGLSWREALRLLSERCAEQAAAARESIHHGEALATATARADVLGDLGRELANVAAVCTPKQAGRWLAGIGGANPRQMAICEKSSTHPTTERSGVSDVGRPRTQRQARHRRRGA